MRAALLAVLAALAIASCGEDDDAGSDKGQMILATTTSTQDSGLLDELTPLLPGRVRMFGEDGRGRFR